MEGPLYEVNLDRTLEVPVDGKTECKALFINEPGYIQVETPDTPLPPPSGWEGLTLVYSLCSHLVSVCKLKVLMKASAR